MTGAAEPRLGCGAAIVRDGRILLVPEAGCWSLPGGKVDLYESAAAAVEREVGEELGIGITVGPLLCIMELIDPARGLHWLAPVFHIVDFAGEPVNVEPHKHAAIGWFALGDPPGPLSEAAKAALRALEAVAPIP